MLTNFTNLAHSTRSSLVFGVILGAIKSTLLVCSAPVDRGVTGSTNIELCKLVELNLDCIIGIPLTLGLGLLRLDKLKSY